MLLIFGGSVADGFRLRLAHVCALLRCAVVVGSGKMIDADLTQTTVPAGQEAFRAALLWKPPGAGGARPFSNVQMKTGRQAYAGGRCLRAIAQASMVPAASVLNVSGASRADVNLSCARSRMSALQSSFVRWPTDIRAAWNENDRQAAHWRYGQLLGGFGRNAVVTSSKLCAINGFSPPRGPTAAA
jgi:hypothetical protein